MPQTLAILTDFQRLFGKGVKLVHAVEGEFEYGKPVDHGIALMKALPPPKERRQRK